MNKEAKARLKGVHNVIQSLVYRSQSMDMSGKHNVDWAIEMRKVCKELKKIHDLL